MDDLCFLYQTKHVCPKQFQSLWHQFNNDLGIPAASFSNSCSQIDVHGLKFSATQLGVISKFLLLYMHIDPPSNVPPETHVIHR